MVGRTLKLDHPPLTPIHIEITKRKYLMEHTLAVKNGGCHPKYKETPFTNKRRDSYTL